MDIVILVIVYIAVMALLVFNYKKRGDNCENWKPNNCHWRRRSYVESA